MAIQEYLPGRPKKQRVKDIRRHLWHYGIRPKERPWRAAWSWANAIANSYIYLHWPTATEIATQYVILLLVEMKQQRSLRLPFRASKVIPPEVRALLPNNPVPLLIQEPVFEEDETTNAD